MVDFNIDIKNLRVRVNTAITDLFYKAQVPNLDYFGQGFMVTADTDEGTQTLELVRVEYYHNQNEVQIELAEGVTVDFMDLTTDDMVQVYEHVAYTLSKLKTLPTYTS